MTLLRKDQPGTAPGGFKWDGPDDVVDVPRDLAAELLTSPDGGFHEVEGPSSESKAAAKKRGGQQRTPIEETEQPAGDETGTDDTAS